MKKEKRLYKFLGPASKNQNEKTCFPQHWQVSMSTASSKDRLGSPMYLDTTPILSLTNCDSHQFRLVVTLKPNVTSM